MSFQTQGLGGHALYLGFYSKYIRKVLRDFSTLSLIILPQDHVCFFPTRLNSQGAALSPSTPHSLLCLGRCFVNVQFLVEQIQRREGYVNEPKPVRSCLHPFSFLPAHILITIHLIAVGLADKVYEKSKFPFIVFYVYYMYYILIILCTKNISYAVLFGEIICKEILYFIFTNTTSVC